ncbi:MAG: hypothetical protein Q4B86_08235 [Eubacteriales bacterium]|nr:hypothetical protein [Eubacteriales bacterium]
MKKTMIALISGIMLTLTAGMAYAGGIGKEYVPSDAQVGPGIGIEVENDLGEVVENPVKFVGHVKELFADNSQILFEANIHTTDENGKPVSTTQEIILNVTEETLILDAVTGMPVKMEDINMASAVYAWTSQAMTLSLPGQTAAHVILVNIPADYAVPQYVVINEIERDSNGNITFVDQDGARYNAGENTSINPYLTRNIVTLQDLEKGSKCLVTVGKAVGKSYPATYTAENIVLFAR